MKTGQKPELEMGLLIDFTKCIGCEACMQGCREANDLPLPGPGDPPPDDLSVDNFTVVLEREIEGQTVYIRRLCMHCQEPACVSACPVGALKKRPDGPVVYDGNMCFGCRYCMTACPFQVPRYPWNSIAPVIRKCILCFHRLDEGQEPACAAACPTGATRFGPRAALLKIARERIRAHPDLYVDHIFGEKEVGGTGVLMLSPVNFASLGFNTDVPQRPLPDLTWAVQKRIPNVVVTLTALLGGTWWVIDRRMQLAKRRDEEQ
jgi:formate dehydrogenase iron-sulfur subunit